MRIVVLYGSQTGTAQDVAELIWRTSKSYNLTGPVLALDDFNLKNLILENFVVFVVSTTGQGDEPDNMIKFWKFLCKRSLPKNSLENLNFAVLGLGDSSYSKFNFVAKRLYKRLVQLSANPVIPVGLADDQHDHGLYGTLYSWLDNLWKSLNLIENIQNCNNYVFKYNITIDEDNNSLNNNLEYSTNSSSNQEFTVFENSRATSEDHFQEVRHIKFNFPSGMNWNPFDVFCVRPWNTDENVNKFFEIFTGNNRIVRSTRVKIDPFDNEMVVPQMYQGELALEYIAKYIWDINSIPRQKVFELMALNCQDETEQEKLLELSSPAGIDDYFKYVIHPRRTVLEVLNDFPCASSKISIEILFEMFGIIREREFSIASIPDENVLQLLVAVVEYKTIMVEKRKGLCSNWLKTLQKDDKIMGYIKTTKIKVPDRIPLILIGPGTGIAPFRSLLMLIEKDVINSNFQNSKRKVKVFFGCRNKNKDFFFKEDFDRLQRKCIADCYFAFSRDQNYKIYVQDLILEQQDSLRNLILFENGNIIISGNANNMPKQVREAFNDIFGNKNYLEEILVKKGRYQEETWS